MEKNERGDILSDYPAEAREGMLKELCHSFEKKLVLTPHTPEKLNQLKDDLSADSVELNKLIINKKMRVKEMDAEIEPFQLRVNEAITQLKNKGVEQEEMVYNIPNHDTGMMEQYNAQGHFIGSRRLFGDEKQINVVQLAAKTGTDNF